MRIEVFYYPMPTGNGNVSVKFFKTLKEAWAFEKKCIDDGLECGDDEAAGSRVLYYNDDGKLLNPDPV